MLRHDVFIQPATETPEEPSTQYLYITEAEDVQGTQAAVAALQDLRYTSENGEGTPGFLSHFSDALYIMNKPGCLSL